MFNGRVIQNKDWQIFFCLFDVCHLGLCHILPFIKKQSLKTPLLRMLLRLFFFLFNSQRDCIKKNSSVCRKKKETTDRAIGQQGNYKAESNSAFQHAHLLQVCLILDFEMQSRGEET